LAPFCLALDLIGLVFLLAMTVTSFRPIRRRLGPTNWRRLHKIGIYALWLLPTYLYLDDFQHDHRVFNLAAVSLLLAALVVRGLAWMRRPGSLWRARWAEGRLPTT
jgi:methionine sulfoxide reductase heme-binding subunit